MPLDSGYYKELVLLAGYWHVRVWPYVVLVAARDGEGATSFRKNVEMEVDISLFTVIAQLETIPGKCARRSQLPDVLSICSLQSNPTYPFNTCLRCS